MKNNMKERSGALDKLVPQSTMDMTVGMLSRHNLWLIVVVVILILGIMSSNIYWAYRMTAMQEEMAEYRCVTETQTIDAEQDGGGNNILAGGDIEWPSESKSPESEPIG